MSLVDPRRRRGNHPMTDLTSLLDELVRLFNAGAADLPSGAIDNGCIFRLNGRAYHETLGRPASDPLVRLVGCGPAGYRFVLTGLRHALRAPGIRVSDESVHQRTTPAGTTELEARATLRGDLRGGAAAWEAECAVQLSADRAGRLCELAVTMGDADLEQLLAARARRD